MMLFLVEEEKEKEKEKEEEEVLAVTEIDCK